LEGRVLPSTLVVNTTSDAGVHIGTSLRDAVVQAEVDSISGISDTIVFNTTQMVGTTITLQQGPLELSPGAGTITISGGGTVAINGGGQSSVFVVDTGAQAILTGLTIEGGGAGIGGGINNTGTLTVNNSTITGDAASMGGGVYNAGTLTVNRTTISGNAATYFGGGIDNAGVLTVTNSTLAGNSAFFGGGIDNGSIMTVSFSTIAGNTASYGGGIDTGGDVPLLADSIVANNTATGAGPDIDGLVGGNNNLIGIGDFMTGISDGVAGNQVGTGASPLNPKLGPLQNNGGSTKTMALLAGSPALHAGTALTTVAKNVGPSDLTITVANASVIASTPGQYFIMIDGEEMQVTSVNVATNTLTVIRAVNGVIGTPQQNDPVFLFNAQAGARRVTSPDLGAYESSSVIPPTITGISTNAGPVAGGTSVTITGTNLGSPTTASVDFGSKPATIISDNGTSIVVTTPPSISGIVNVTVGAPGGVATSPVKFAYVIYVTTASDVVSHTGTSLRDAIAQADTAAAAGSSALIAFDPSLAGATITLAQGQLELNGAGTGSITIDGTGLSSPLTISGNNASRVFLVDAGVHASFKGLTIQGGEVSNNNGGGIYNNGTLWLDSDIIQNNNVNNATLPTNSVVGGGGIYNNSILTLTNDTLSGNSATSSNVTGSGFGGAIYNNGTLTVSADTLTGNSATEGGAIFNNKTLSLSNATLFGNDAGVAGGGIVNVQALTASNDTISGNSAGKGGGIDNSGTLVLLNTIVAGNTSTTLPAPGLGPDILGAVAAGSGHDLIGIGAGMTGISNNDVHHDLVGTVAVPINPLLGPLASNGGATQTMALLPGSPAVAKGGAIAVLPGGITATATTITVSNGAAIAVTPGRFIIQIAGEQMLVTNVSGNTLTVIRGYNGTTAAAQSASAPVYLATDQRGAKRYNPPDIGAYVYVAAPSITTNPVDKTVSPGQTVSFTAAATGVPTPTVQWQVSTNNGVTFTNIVGATSTTLTFTAQTMHNGRQYRAVFTNAAGSATTSAATLHV
jgi:hypothetical protein